MQYADFFDNTEPAPIGDVLDRMSARGVAAAKRFLAGETLSEADTTCMAMVAGVKYSTHLREDGQTEFTTERCAFAVVDGKIQVVTMRPDRRGKSVRFGARSSEQESAEG